MVSSFLQSFSFIFPFPNQRRVWSSVQKLLLLVGALVLVGCSSKSTSFQGVDSYNPKQWGIKDKDPTMWASDNTHVRKFMKRYGSTKTVETCLRRSRSNGYLRYIHRVFYKYRLPPELAHLPILESCFDPKARSRTGALGLWQFTDITTEHLGMKTGWFWDDRLDWKKSTHFAARYLDELGKRFNYDWAIVLAAYNGGPTYLDQAMKKQNTRNFWELKLRQETTEYVPKFLAMLRVAREKFPELYYQGAPKFWIVKSDIGQTET